MRLAYVILPVLTAALLAGAATIQEDFAGDPAAKGWREFGETNLFHWNPTNQNLEITWDSSQTNSYFYHPLPTILARDDDFSLAFDLRLDDIAVGVDTNKPSTFQITVALLNFADATRTNFFRGAGVDPVYGPRNTVEFDYFPESPDGSISATVSPTITSSNNQFATSFTFPLELTLGDVFHIEMSYTASNGMLATLMTRNGQPFGPVQNTAPGGAFTDFRVDSVAVCSYSDAGQSPPDFAGSVLAHGVVDNVAVVTPPPPVENISGGFSNGLWQVQFLSRSNWLYTLERSGDFGSWTNASPATLGTGTNLALPDANAPMDKAFYRVRAERP